LHKRGKEKERERKKEKGEREKYTNTDRLRGHIIDRIQRAEADKQIKNHKASFHTKTQ